MKVTHNHIQKLDLGSDSSLDLIEILGEKFILKTYLDYNATFKRNRELAYQKELKSFGFQSLEFKHLENFDKNQLCIKYIEDLQIFAEVTDLSYFAKLAEYLKELSWKSATNKNNLVTDSEVLEVDYLEYYNWIIEDIPKRQADIRYTVLANKIIKEIIEQKNNLVLLHSDFHVNNIGLANEKILLFDSGYVKFLFGHQYHDISRLILVYPEGIIFPQEDINPRILYFVESFDEINPKNLEFLKFCYIQTLLVYNNPFVKRVKEICEFLYQKLSIEYITN